MPGTLVNELAAALDRMVEDTCASMRGLWLLATTHERADLAGRDSEASRPELPIGFAKWKPPMRSKYGALARFRHAVVWRIAEGAWSPATSAGAVFFTPCRDAPPFANPSDGRSSSGRALLVDARADLTGLLAALRERAPADERWTDLETQVARELVERALRPTLRDTLKMEAPEFRPLFEPPTWGRR